MTALRSWLTLALVACASACRSPLESAVATPSFENGRRLFSLAQPAAAGEALARLSSEKRTAWLKVLDERANELRTSSQTDTQFCEMVDKLGLDDEKAAQRWHQVHVVCAGLLANVNKQVEQQGRLEALRGELATVAGLKKEAADAAAQERRATQGGGIYNGFIIARLEGNRYEVAQLRTVYEPEAPCLDGPAACNRNAFRQMAAPAEVPSEDHDILETTKTSFETKGRFRLRVRLKTTEHATNRSGFKQNIDVYEEVEEESWAERQQKERAREAAAKALVARETAARQGLSQAVDNLADARIAVDTARLARLLACLGNTPSRCASLDAKLPGGDAPTQPDVARYGQSMIANKTSTVIELHRVAGVACGSSGSLADGRAMFVCAACPSFQGITCGSGFAGEPVSLAEAVYTGASAFEKVKDSTKTLDGWRCSDLQNPKSCTGHIHGDPTNLADERLSVVLTRTNVGAIVRFEVDQNDPHGEGACCDDDTSPSTAASNPSTPAAPVAPVSAVPVANTPGQTPTAQANDTTHSGAAVVGGLSVVATVATDEEAWAVLKATSAPATTHDIAKAANDRGYRLLNAENAPDRALPFFEFAAKTDSKFGMPRYNAAKCLASRNDVDGVVRYLGEVRALGKGQRDRLMAAKSDPSFASVANDARFQALFE